MSAKAVREALRDASDPEKAAFYPTFFKAGKGEYAEGDRFIGVVVPEQRKIAKRFRELPMRGVQSLLKDPFHECRLTGLLILAEKFRRGDEDERARIVDCYIGHLDWVNNWDLVDSSAYPILGAWLIDRDRGILGELARSGHLWRQRVAIIATLAFIKADEYDDTLEIADLLLHHEHDLIHKAVGWMLREVGQRNQEVEEGFLLTRYKGMPRTMLRYAIEKFPEERRKAYLSGDV